MRNHAMARTQHHERWLRLRQRAGIPLLVLGLLAPGAVALGAQELPALAGGSTSVVVTSTGVVTHGAIASNENTVGWLLRCDYSHSGTDDPIMMPGMAGMSHRHDFFGNVSTNASSTVVSMLASGTSCGTAADTAAYWTPSLYVNGQLVPPDQTSQQIYYRFKYPAGTQVVPMPTDLRIVVGNHTATSIAENPALSGEELYWECDGNSSTHYVQPPSCSSGVILENIQFPSCWDGTLGHGLGSLNDDAHLAYTPNGQACPAAYPIALPRISLKVKYEVGTNGNAVTLSSGPAAGAHADFWNTWQPAGLRYLVAKCINAGISCGTNPVAPVGS